MCSRKTCDLHWFVERDIDLLIAEELKVNNDFAKWFLDRCNCEDKLTLPASVTEVSVVEDGSEADVIATFEGISGQHRLYIEDKIDAKLMPEQLERYVRRAKNDQKLLKNISWSVVAFTPSVYRIAEIPTGVVQITFEEAAVELRRQSNSQQPRLDYKASFLENACPVSGSGRRDAKVIETEPFIKVWWDEVYLMLDRSFPGYFAPPNTRYPRSVYFAPSVGGLAQYLRVDFKGHKGEVDLAFKSIGVNDLMIAVEALPSCPGILIENGRSSAIRIDGLPKFIISDGIEIIDTKVHASFDATKRLIEFWRKHRAVFDAMASSLK